MWTGWVEGQLCAVVIPSGVQLDGIGTKKGGCKVRGVLLTT